MLLGVASKLWSITLYMPEIWHLFSAKSVARCRRSLSYRGLALRIRPEVLVPSCGRADCALASLARSTCSQLGKTENPT